MTKLAKSRVEDAAFAWFSDLGYEIAADPNLGPDGITPQRVSYRDVVLAAPLQHEAFFDKLGIN